MSKEKIYIFDTTLRDGAQTEGVDFSIEDKNKIANVLSDIGVDYIEGGWPGANPNDTKFFSNPPHLKKSIFTAFGMTKKTGRSADNDPGLASLMNANSPAVCVVGIVDADKISPETISNAIALVKVPPTSMPILTRLLLIYFCSRFSH